MKSHVNSFGLFISHIFSLVITSTAVCVWLLHNEWISKKFIISFSEEEKNNNNECQWHDDVTYYILCLIAYTIRIFARDFNCKIMRIFANQHNSLRCIFFSFFFFFWILMLEWIINDFQLFRRGFCIGHWTFNNSNDMQNKSSNRPMWLHIFKSFISKESVFFYPKASFLSLY